MKPKDLSVAIGAAILHDQYEADKARTKAIHDNNGERITFLQEHEEQANAVIELPKAPPAPLLRETAVTTANPVEQEPVTYKSLIKAATDFVVPEGLRLMAARGGKTVSQFFLPFKE